MSTHETIQVEFQSVDLNRLQQFADLLVHHLAPPLTIGLVGTLAAGKTTLAQAIARAVGVDPADVTSPTFTLLQSHQGKFTLHHLDAYRLADEDEFLELGVDELFDDPSAWTLIEWADRVMSVMPTTTLWIDLTISANNTREISLRAPYLLAEGINRIRNEFAQDEHSPGE